MKLITIHLLFFVLILSACSEKTQEKEDLTQSPISTTETKESTIPQTTSKKPKTTKPVVDTKAETNNPQSFKETIQNSIQPPLNYQRTATSIPSYATFLRNLPLKPKGTKVSYYNGAIKLNNGVYHRVVDLPIGTKDLHQCADAIMRLRAEYLWSQKQYDKIHFNFTNGFRVEYAEWRKGRRIIVNGNKTEWDSGNKASTSYKDFWKYMEQIFMYAGTASLEKELLSVPINQAKVGDILIQGGHPGHAVIIVDEVEYPQTGDRLFLLAQSYMPAQEIQILNNPTDQNISPWYELKEGTILTPEWTFYSDNLKRFMN